jgi:hypothetical protein
VVHLRAGLRDLASRGAFEGARSGKQPPPVRRAVTRETAGAGLRQLRQSESG